MPTPATVWLAQHGRYLRTISAWRLRQACQRKDGECTWCGGPLRGRQTAWCSQLCIDSFLQLQPRHMRAAVHARDHGRCRRCGRDGDRMFHLARRLLGLAAHGHADWRNVVIALRDHWASVGYGAVRDLTTEHYWEANHIVPVCEGGGLCSLDNLETLCVPCHTCVTKELHRRRRKVRATVRPKQKKKLHRRR